MTSADERGDSPSPILRGAVGVTALLTAAGLLGQLCTLIREVFVASQVGISTDLDALLVAQVAPTIIAGLVSSGTASALVPAYLAVQQECGKAEAQRLLGAIMSWTAIVGVLAAGLVMVGANAVVIIAGPGLDSAAREVAAGFVPIMAAGLVFLALAPILVAAFQIHGRMRVVSVAWFVGPFVSVIVTILLWPGAGLTALALGITLQQFATFAVLAISAIWMGLMPSPTIRANAVEAKRFVGHALPLTISASVLTMNLLIDRAIATLIAPGAASALRYADGVIRLPLNAVAPAWSAAIYPALVSVSRLDDTQSLGHAASAALRYVLAVFVPISVATAALAPAIVTLAYGRGAFDANASALTAAALVGFAPLLVLTLANTILTGSHNARRRGSFLMVMGILSAILNAVFDLGLGWLIGVAGIALASSTATAVVQLVKAWRLSTLDEAFPVSALIRTGLRAMAASAVVALPAGAIAWSAPRDMGFLPTLGLLVTLTGAGMVGYVAVARMIGLTEPWTVVQAMSRIPGRVIPGLHR